MRVIYGRNCFEAFQIREEKLLNLVVLIRWHINASNIFISL
jgi:hypothetical protein